jgi:hypothetical protein
MSDESKSQERHFECAVCGKGFLSRLELTEHEKSCPTGVPPAPPQSRSKETIVEAIEDTVTRIKHSGSRGHREVDRYR